MTLSIAVDGPGGAGKSTIAKRLAAELGLEYIDTGAMYRAVAYKADRMGIGAGTPGLEEMLADTDIDFEEGRVMLDGEDVSDRIRTPEISMKASAVSAVPAVRKKLVALQRAMGENKSVIMDGRDIGTNVLPGAGIKIFLTASPEVRARRRYDELIAGGAEADYDRVLSDIKKRDENDMTRETDPLRKAADAVEIDTSGMEIDEVVAAIKSIVRDGV